MKHLPLRSHDYGQLLHDFTGWIATLGYAESSVYGLPLYLREFLHFLEQQQIESLEEVSSHQTEQFLEYLAKRGNLRRGGLLSASHRNKYIQAIKLLAKFWQITDRGILPLEISRLKVARKLESILSPEEVQTLYACCDPTTAVGIRDRAMLSIYYGCGLRRSEGTGLDVRDVLSRRKLLYVRKGKNYQERYVPLTTAIIADLQTYLHQGRPVLLGKQYTSAGRHSALLLSERGKRIQSQSLLLRLKILCHRAGLSHRTITLHTLRHSIATHLLQSGMALQDIARFLGHRSLEATQIYTHLDDARGL